MTPGLRDWFIARVRNAPRDAQPLLRAALDSGENQPMNLERTRAPLSPVLEAALTACFAEQGLQGLLDPASLAWGRGTCPSSAAYSAGNRFCQVFGVQDAAGKGARGGFYLLEPHLHYPNHRHKPVEGYLLLHGDMAWSYDDGPLITPNDPFDVLITPANQPHAMRSGPNAAVALWFWYGDVRPDSWAYC